ncbi:hypothetical protein N9933_01150 [bacterium]|nr:hypothetical protein [bacterium]
MENINRIYKGLNKDHSLQDQPKETYSFALNTTAETQAGDIGFLSNEESNEICFVLPTSFVPIGKIYIGKGQTAIFLTKDDNTEAIIGIQDDSCNFTIHVQTDLNFNRNSPIDATYRLRRGCERVIYFTDNLNKPRIYNFDQPDDFKTLGVWDASKFSLTKTYASIPEFDSITVENSGELEPGSYNFGVQYLDADLNPTEFMTTSDTVIIYHDNLTSKDYPYVRGSGSIDKKTIYSNFDKTNKSIRVELSNFDIAYPYYRIAIIEATAGTGRVSRVVYSKETPIEISTFIYSGQEGYVKGTVEEVQAYGYQIERARHILQLENKLVLMDTEGADVNFCDLQQFASKIKADLVLKSVDLNNGTSVNNPKRGNYHNESIGYQPGEIYAFGIYYIFDDNSISPVYHIPGRNSTTASTMSLDNASVSDVYVDTHGCQDLWGTDYTGLNLTGQPIRHHRFPLRTEVLEPLVTEIPGSGLVTKYELIVSIQGKLAVAWPTGQDIDVRVSYTIDTGSGPVAYTKNFMLLNGDYDPGPGFSGDVLIDTAINPSVILFTQIEEYDTVGGSYVAFGTTSGLTETIQPIKTIVSDIGVPQFTSNIMGIEFSNILLPTISGKTVIGYQVVRAKRDEGDKTVLDNGVLVPMLDEASGIFCSHGHLFPTNGILKEDIFALIHPEHKFNGREYTGVTDYIKEGRFFATAKSTASIIAEDVQPGTSYDSSRHKKRERDTDGYSFHGMTRNSNLTYFGSPTGSFADETEIEDIFYLDALFGKTVVDVNLDRKDVYNLSGDNRIGIVQLNKSVTSGVEDNLTYVVMKRDLSNPYTDFLTRPYYTETNNPKYFSVGTETVEIFNGDSYISSMRYTSTMHYDISLKFRGSKTSLWNHVLGVLSIIVGAVLTVVGVVTGGAVSALGIAVIGFGASQISAGLEKDQVRRIYTDLYEQGLNNTVDDDDTEDQFGAVYTSTDQDDDEIQMLCDTATNIWFESGVNMNWRNGATEGITDFLDSPGSYIEKELLSYLLEKATNIDTSADTGRAYQGYSKAEIYDLNKDYTRRNWEKLYYHLPLEYDCCSDCREDFPHRVHVSETSFQEELSDNFRVFLPNNYIDIEGETGVITNGFKIQDNLYIHTEEALWHLPKTFQERVTGDIVSFIGTGSFFSVPPRKILDGDTGHSAGSQHKWGTVKTPHGVFFPSERQRIFYKFDGNKLENLSNKGLFSWSKENMEVTIDKQFFEIRGVDYELRDNTTSLSGSGYISVYDSRKERVIFTKKDYVLVVSGNISTLQDNSFTISYSLKTGTWTSFHSYMPEFYIQTPEHFYSWGNLAKDEIWRHGVKGNYQTFYGTLRPYIVEYVSMKNPLQTKVWNDITFLTEAKKYNAVLNYFGDENDTTFNKAILYNASQCSGELTLTVKNTKAPTDHYLLSQIINLVNIIPIDRSERNWKMNDMRDIRIDYTVPIFDAALGARQPYFIDKVLNTSSMDSEKDWTQLELFRDKFLVIRLIFDNLADTQLTLNYSVENETPSIR